MLNTQTKILLPSLLIVGLGVAAFNDGLRYKASLWFLKTVSNLKNSDPASSLDEDILAEKIKVPLEPWAQEQIHDDLKNFQNVTHDSLEKIFKEEDTEFNRLLKITVKGSQAFFTMTRKENEQLIPYNVMKSVFSYLAKKDLIPDTKIIVSLQDHLKLTSKQSVPIFAFEKDTNQEHEKDLILIPHWQNLKNWKDLKPRIELANNHYPLEKKINKLIWRGDEKDKSGLSHILVQAKNPLIDAAFIKNSTKNNFSSPEERIAYKYQMTLGGTHTAFEDLVWQLESKCVVLKSNSSNIQWYYKGLQPHVHYYPVDSNVDSVLKAMEWLEKNPIEMQKISISGGEFVEAHLTLESMIAYIAKLVTEYSKKCFKQD
jgi:hypothetical protein